MNGWGPATFGDPCDVCGFEWSMATDDAQSVIVGCAERISDLVRGGDGHARHADLEWNVAGYVSHVADSLRVWAERLASIALGDQGPVAEYNQEDLARARSYADLGLNGALWSLDRAVGDWRAATELAARHDATMTHPELGTLAFRDVVVIRAHDVHHHEHDLRRTVEVA